MAVLYEWRGHNFATVRGLRAHIRKQFPGRVSLGVSELHVSFADGSIVVFDVSAELRTREKPQKIGGPVNYGWTVQHVCDAPKTTISPRK